MGGCFVITGFGEKTDFQWNPQRVLTLNRTYEDITKPAVVEAGHVCMRETIAKKPIGNRRSG